MIQVIEPTQEMLSKFIGGQHEVHDKRNTYVYRGEIQNMTLCEGTISITYVWQAKLVDGIWYEVKPETYATDITVSLFAARRDGVLCYQTTIIGEIGTLFPQSWHEPLRRPVVSLKEET